MNGKQHTWLFLICFTIFAIYSRVWYGLYFRVIFAIVLIPLLNPDFDLTVDLEGHRFFFTHSLIPSTLFWWCLLPALQPSFQWYVLVILWFYPSIHLIGDLKLSFNVTAYNGTWRVAFFPYIRIITKNNRKKIDLKYPRFSLLGSWIWYLGNIGIGIIGSIVILV